MATKQYFVGPEDGWVNVMTTGASFSTIISGYPHTHPFYVYGHPTVAPTAGVGGLLVCHKAFKSENSTTAGNKDAFYVRVPSPGNGRTGQQGRIRIDVYTDGGTLA